MSSTTKTTKYIIKTSAACMPGSCWGTYRNVAVLEVDASVDDVKMISERARGVVRIVRYAGKLHVGRTDRAAYQRELKIAESVCAAMNAGLADIHSF